MSGLTLNLGPDGLFFGVAGAGEHEVVEDHDAVQVAEPIEPLVKIPGASPHTDHVRAGAYRIINDMIPSISRPESFWNDVDASAVDLLTVDLQRER